MESIEHLKEALDKAEKQIAELHREKKSFLKIVSHDLRSPISRIIGFADLLKRDLEDQEDLRPFAENIEAAGWNLSKTIARIVEVEHFLAEERELILQEVDLVASAESLLYDIQYDHPDRDIKIDHTGEPIVARVDKPYFDKIFTNLVSNACKFSDQDQPVIVAFKVAEDHIRMEVTDSGPGIPEEEEKLLFKKFSRISIRPTNDEATTGLGLFVVKTCAEAIGAQVSYRKSDEVGSVFAVSFYNS